MAASSSQIASISSQHWTMRVQLDAPYARARACCASASFAELGHDLRVPFNEERERLGLAAAERAEQILGLVPELGEVGTDRQAADGHVTSFECPRSAGPGEGGS